MKGVKKMGPSIRKFTTAQIVVLASVTSIFVSSPAEARPGLDRVLDAHSGQIRLDPHDLFSSDGAGVYSSPGSLDAYLYDDKGDDPAADDANHDYLSFRPQKESYFLNSTLVDGDATQPGNQPVPCAAGESISFASERTTNWIESLGRGASVTGDPSALCYSDLDSRTGAASGYVIHYQDPGAGDCGVLTRLAENGRTYVLDVPAADILSGIHLAGCAAVVYSFEKTPSGNDYTWEYQFVGKASSPLNITITLHKEV